MKDSRAGAIGVIVLIVSLLLQISSLIKLHHLAPVSIIIASFWGRCAQFWAIEKFPYLNEESKSNSHKYYWKGIEEIMPSLIIVLVFITPLILLSTSSTLSTISITIFGVITCIVVPQLIGKQLKGHNGDSYGASLVITETAMLMAIAFILPSV